MGFVGLKNGPKIGPETGTVGKEYMHELLILDILGRFHYWSSVPNHIRQEKRPKNWPEKWPEKWPEPAELPRSYVDDWDASLDSFSIAEDLDFFVPVLKMALAENPRLTVMAVPWSAPGWMKDSNHQHGGSLLPENTDLYAR